MPRQPKATTVVKPPAPHHCVPVAKWVTEGRKVVVCVGGPLDDHWYFVEAWEKSVAAARNFVELGCHDNSVYLQYSATDATRDHPSQPVVGQVLRWRGPSRKEK